MDLGVEPEEVIKVLKSVRELIRDNILPRLTQIEQDVKTLRRATWPICQSLREHNQLDGISGKREFLQTLEHDEAVTLLRLKSKGLLVEELGLLSLQRNNTR
jgi:hypothetical protein